MSGGSHHIRPKKTKYGRYVKDISLAEIQACFDVPSTAAAEKLGVGLTMLKRICRTYGIERWPYRRPKDFLQRKNEWRAGSSDFGDGNSIPRDSDTNFQTQPSLGLGSLEPTEAATWTSGEWLEDLQHLENDILSATVSGSPTIPDVPNLGGDPLHELLMDAGAVISLPADPHGFDRHGGGPLDDLAARQWESDPLMHELTTAIRAACAPKSPLPLHPTAAHTPKQPFTDGHSAPLPSPPGYHHNHHRHYNLQPQQQQQKQTQQSQEPPRGPRSKKKQQQQQQQQQEEGPAQHSSGDRAPDPKPYLHVDTTAVKTRMPTWVMSGTIPASIQRMEPVTLPQERSQPRSPPPFAYHVEDIGSMPLRQGTASALPIENMQQAFGGHSSW